jgi:membrane protein DedA with SNARE-associated domain/membrane-associated phospholipid phosphatase
MLSHLHHFHPLFQNLIPFFDQWGYLIVAITAFLEGLPIIGYISPGGISTILAGFLVRNHLLKLWPVLLLAIIGAFLGDLLAYILGRIYGHNRLRLHGKYLYLKEEHIDKTQELLQKHGGKAIIFGRFNYLTRSLSPFLAGTSGINLWKFIFFGLVSSVLWSTAHIGAGIVFGQAYRVAARYINYLLLGATILAVLIFYAYRFVNARRHIFQKYHIYTLTFNILSIYLFAKVLEDVSSHEWLYRFDFMVYQWIPHLWNTTGIFLMTFVSNLFEPAYVFLFTCIFIGYLLRKKEYYYSLLSALAISFGVIAEYSLKLIIGFTRPVEGILVESSYSFPSGHATIVSIFGILLYHCLRKDLKSRAARNGLLIGVIFLILLVGASRIYLNLHWLSDILAGYALGIFSVTFFILFLRWGRFFGTQLLKIGKAIFEPFKKSARMGE